MAPQATAAIIGDLRALLEALLDGEHSHAWGRSKTLNEAINCTATDGLPDREHVLTMLCCLVAEELKRTLEQPRQH